MTDEYSDLDAAYLLGSLSPTERRAYESHLKMCANCSASVAELTVLPGLLSRVSVSDVEQVSEPMPVPTSILSKLVAVARRRQRRSRSLVAGLVAAVAVASVAVTTILPQQIPVNPGQQAVEVTLSHVVASPLDADIRLIAHEWGTSIDVECRYAAGSRHYGAGAVYGMYVTDFAGNTTQLSTWSARPGSNVELTGTTNLSLVDIRKVDVRTVASGEILLSGTP